MITHTDSLRSHLTEQLWTSELARAIEELRARHPEASFEVAGVEVALARAIEQLADKLAGSVPSVAAVHSSEVSLGNG